MPSRLSIRTGVFETNSSATHSICMAPGETRLRNQILEVTSGKAVVPTMNFGTNEVMSNDAMTKASYVMRTTRAAAHGLLEKFTGYPVEYTLGGSLDGAHLKVIGPVALDFVFCSSSWLVCHYEGYPPWHYSYEAKGHPEAPPVFEYCGFGVQTSRLQSHFDFSSELPYVFRPDFEYYDDRGRQDCSEAKAMMAKLVSPTVPVQAPISGAGAFTMSSFVLDGESYSYGRYALELKTTAGVPFELEVTMRPFYDTADLEQFADIFPEPPDSSITGS